MSVELCSNHRADWMCHLRFHVCLGGGRCAVFAAVRGMASHCTALHCTALHCTALHCTALQAEASITTFVVLSVVVLLVKLVGTFSGYTLLFSDKVNFAQFVINISGTVRLAWWIIFEGGWVVVGCAPVMCLVQRTQLGGRVVGYVRAVSGGVGGANAGVCSSSQCAANHLLLTRVFFVARCILSGTPPQSGQYNFCWVLFATHLIPSLLIEIYVWLAIFVFKTI